MRSFNYVTLDVFTTTRYSGNQLAIVLLRSSGPVLTNVEKQQIAREFNYYETVFLHDPDETRMRKLEIFNRYTEIHFAGVPVIGATQFVFQTISDAAEKANTVFNLKAGQTVIGFDSKTGLASAEVPQQFRIHGHPISRAALVQSHPELTQIKDQLPETCPVVSYVKGMTFYLVDLTTVPEFLGFVKQAVPPLAELDEDYRKNRGVFGTVFFCSATQDLSGRRQRHSFRMRRFMVNGVEDPATGGAACSLAGWYSVDRRLGPGKIGFEFEQGAEMGRPSRLFVDIELNGERSCVKSIVLSGQAVTVMEGKLAV